MKDWRRLQIMLTDIIGETLAHLHTKLRLQHWPPAAQCGSSTAMWQPSFRSS